MILLDIEMPKNCFTCPCRGFDGFTQMWLCNIKPIKAQRDGRPEECPLIELAEHGDLIDRDSLQIDDAWEVVETNQIWDAPVVIPSNRVSTEE